MVARRRIGNTAASPPAEREGNYFLAPARDVAFFSTGCKMLDLTMGGGWAENRVANVIGDKSTGKTLLMIEASANFCLKYPDGKVRYREREQAFDYSYARAIGMPIDRIDFGDKANPADTVDDLVEEIEYRCNLAQEKRKARKKVPSELFIVDSLDSYTTRKELTKKIGIPAYGGDKASLMSEFFRRMMHGVVEANMTLIFVSQIRDDMNAQNYGRKVKRTGGHALDFYTSQMVYLIQLNKIYHEYRGIKRATGVNVLAALDKNKIGLPYRNTQFPILFGYGIDDVTACMKFMKASGGFGGMLGTAKESAFRQAIMEKQGDWQVVRDRMHEAVTQRWYEIEEHFLPKVSKYG